MSDKKIRLLAVASSTYFDMMVSLINSASVNFKEAIPHIALINLSEKEKNVLEKINTNLECTNINIEFENIYQQQIFCINYRSRMLVDLRKKYPNDVLLWMDTDSVIRKNVDKFKEQLLMNDYDIMALVRERRKNKYKYPKVIAAIFAVNNTEIGNIFIKKYDKSINVDAYKTVKNKIKKNNSNWALWIQTQNNLMKLIVKIKGLKYKLIDKKFFDVDFKKNTCIWNALADKRKDSRFIKESEKYRDIKIYYEYKFNK